MSSCAVSSCALRITDYSTLFYSRCTLFTLIMKIGIIGAGNMGGAIARGIARNTNHALVVSSPNRHGELDSLRLQFPAISVSTDNADAVCGADIIILAVKPWLIDNVMAELSGKIDYNRQVLASVVAGVDLNHLAGYAQDCDAPVVFRIIPNIAIAQGESMTFIAAKNAQDSQIGAICGIFEPMGRVMVVEERLMGAGTALASCGIAYAMRYVRAAMEGGIELGFTPRQSLEIVLQTVSGAVAMLAESGEHPEVAIDRVTTAGGITIKGLNAMERNGFSASVIEGLKASVTK